MPTPQLGLTYLTENQEQGEIRVNEITDRFDAHIHLSVKDKDATTPPGSPAEGDRYHLGGSPTGAWAGEGGKIAITFNGTWYFFPPKEGWRMWVDNEDTIYVYNGTTWVVFAGAPVSVAHRAAITIETPTGAEDQTMFRTNVALTISRMNAVLVAPTTGSPSVTWTVRHDPNRNATGNAVVTGGTVTTNTTTGDDITAMNDPTVPSGSWIWVETTASNLTTNEHINITLTYTED